MNDLVERLREANNGTWVNIRYSHALHAEAADRITFLETALAQALADGQRQSLRAAEQAREKVLKHLANKLEIEVRDFVQEHFSYDFSTGVWETRNAAKEEWVSDREELIERIRGGHYGQTSAP